MMNLRLRLYAVLLVCCLAPVSVILLSPIGTKAQTVSSTVAYEQTEPAQWEHIPVTSGLPEEAPPSPVDAQEMDGDNSTSENPADPKDYYDTLDFYEEDYPEEPQEKKSRSSAEVSRSPDEATPENLPVTEILTYILATIAITGLFALLLWYRTQARNVAFNISEIREMGEVLGHLRLNSRTVLYYVQTGETVLLLGTTPRNVSLLDKFPVTAFSGEYDKVSRMVDTDNSPTLDSNPAPEFSQADMHLLRKDIQALQQAIQELRKHHL